MGQLLYSEPLLKNAWTEATQSKLFTTSGTFTIPKRTIRLQVWLVGGGGGSGYSSGYAHEIHVSSGAGAGGFCYKEYTSSELSYLAGTNISVLVGSGGANLTNGGTSKFLNQSANGGEQGYPPVGAASQRGGYGGTATGGDINQQGNSGATGSWVGCGGIGWGGAGTNIAGVVYGTGGSSEYSGLPQAGTSGVVYLTYTVKKMKGT